MAEVSTGRRSYFAMLLSVIVPGLGQIYLRKPLKALVLFLGVGIAGGIIYVNSLPVNHWTALTDFSELRRLWENRGKGNSETEAVDSADENRKERPHYHVYSLHGDLRFRMKSELLNDLNHTEYVSVDLHREFQAHKILLPDDATTSIRRPDSYWTINSKYQTYAVKKEGDELNVYDVRKVMFRPSWKFKVSGLAQGVLFWLSAIFDGWQGRRGLSRRALRRKMQKARANSDSGKAGQLPRPKGRSL